MNYEFISNQERFTYHKRLGFILQSLNSVTNYHHVHNEIEIAVVTEGTLNMKIGQREYEIPAGHAAFVNPYEPHTYISRTPNQCWVAEFSSYCYEPIYDWLAKNYTEDRVLGVQPELMAFLSSEVSSVFETYYNTQVNTIQMHALLAPLCNLFIRGFRWTDHKPQCNDLVLKALDIITNNDGKPLSRSYIASQIGVAPETLSRKFKETTGLSFVYYLQQYRVSQALQCLRNGCSISDAAFEAGFNTIRNFNRVFLEIVGYTPREYLNIMNH